MWDKFCLFLLCFNMLLSTVFYLLVIFYRLFSQTLFQRGDTLSATLGHVIFLFPIYSPLGKSFCIFHWNKWWIAPFVEQATVIQQFHSKWEDKTKSKQIQQRLEEGKPPNNWFKLINTLKDSCQNNVTYFFFFFQKETLSTYFLSRGKSTIKVDIITLKF